MKFEWLVLRGLRILVILAGIILAQSLMSRTLPPQIEEWNQDVDDYIKKWIPEEVQKCQTSTSQ